jgi:hypothetical protein
MNWHYGQPITDGQYLCCVKGYSSPFILDWHDREWGRWNGKWYPLDNIITGSVVCYIGFDEIPMPEGW